MGIVDACVATVSRSMAHRGLFPATLPRLRRNNDSIICVLAIIARLHISFKFETSNANAEAGPGLFMTAPRVALTARLGTEP